MRVALVHDDLVQWGGAERVLLGLCELFPEAPIYTSVFDTDNELLRKNFVDKRIITSFIQKIPGWRNFYRALLPLYPPAFEQFDFSGFDLVISQTTRFAKSVITKPQTRHICYCHTPPRFLWNFSGYRVGGILQPYLSFLKVPDQISSRRVDLWVAGSANAQRRIQAIYKADSKVIFPFVETEKFSQIEKFDGGYLLVLSRLNSYKRVDIVVEAANRLGLPLKVVGGGPQLSRLVKIAGPTVEFLGNIGDDLVPMLLAGCTALVVAGEEDFGLAPLEAQAAGSPVVAYKKGGTLETVIPGQTGYLFEDQTVDSLISALVALDRKGYNQKRCKQQAGKFSKENFLRSFREFVSSI